jgi:two-component system chemotaxis response regulator CheY
MIADDNIFVRMMLKEIIAAYGYQVIGEADNGIIAIEMYKQLQPDLVITDVALPGMNGIDVVKAMLAIDDKANIIISSNKNQYLQVLQALQAGAKSCIVKPLQQSCILQALDKIFPR